ncbi:LysR family transcriptional regulator [Bacillus aerolatus]|uniref:LysR family transcriptional regulator n=1 Tax=Bacillus aerolatus TaxID=2653354 RepID=A0A6I1FK40_9BACI|nr:LysR family transcriptional regulator [Bacillus aerolatus]KAB7707086.1 LysR family transcriptional regulator [Bacillus aerolatus]
MDIQKLRYFVEIVEKGSLTKAAIALNMTQPPLSSVIKKLELELGVQLFDRRGKRLILTDTGRLLYNRAKNLIASADTIMNELVEQNKGLKGQVAVGCSTNANLTIIPKVVQRINDTSNIVINVKEGNTSYILDELRNHKLDVGIVRNVFKKDDLHNEILFTEPLMLALPPNHRLLRKKRDVRIEDLKDEKFLLQATTFGHGISEIIIEECQASGFFPNVIYWGTETLPMLNMVQMGLGIAFLPKSFLKLESFNFPPIVEIEDSRLVIKISLVTFKDRIHKASTDKFLEITKGVIDDMYDFTELYS